MTRPERRNRLKISARVFHWAILTIPFALFSLISLLIVPSISMGETNTDGNRNLPLWWADTHKRAESGGYDLITLQELHALIQSKKEVFLLDVRPDYEYRDGHLPGAQHFEFHLGHRSGLEPERAEALKALLGADRNRLIVTYCRNFR